MSLFDWLPGGGAEAVEEDIRNYKKMAAMSDPTTICPQCGAEHDTPELLEAQDRIQSLEAPFILTDTPPSEPGWYVMATDLDPAIIVDVRVIAGELCAGKCPVSFYPPTHKWGSAPLPLPLENINGK